MPDSRVDRDLRRRVRREDIGKNSTADNIRLSLQAYESKAFVTLGRPHQRAQDTVPDPKRRSLALVAQDNCVPTCREDLEETVLSA